MSKLIKFNDDARKSMQEGIDLLANAVKCTLGPKGKTVIIEEFDGPHITKDGVTVAKSIDLEDKFQNIGAQLVKQVASKTCDEVGDGTTTSCVLTQAIINEGMKSLALGSDPIAIKKGIDVAVKEVINYVKAHSIPVNDKISQVATISANNDIEIGELIAKAMHKVTQDGIITVEEAKGRETTIETVEGMRFDRGYSSQYFITDTETQKCILENPIILVCEKKISNVKDLLPVLEPAAKANRSILIVAEDIDSEVLNTLVMNKIRAGLNICAVRSPGFGELKIKMIEDLAILVGASVYSDKVGLGSSEITSTTPGSCDKVIVTKNSTSIIGGHGNTETISSRIAKIKFELENATHDYEINQCKDRLSKISGGVAIIKVGASTEVELKEKKDRIEDALCAVRAALEEGIVPGGGLTYYRCSKLLKTTLDKEDEQIGYNIIKKALLYPIKQIALNTGISPDVVINGLSVFAEDYGYDAKNGEYCHLVNNGIIDPTKVTRCAIENAASIAGLFLTTDCIIAEKPYEGESQQKSFFI